MLLVLNQLAHTLNQYACPQGQIKCLSGTCAYTIDECPTEVTCPILTHPIKCQDGSCVKAKEFCQQIDTTAELNLHNCLNQGLLLCSSDLTTCTTSLSFCPLKIKQCNKVRCWDGSCADAAQSCPTLNPFVYTSCPN